MTTETKDRPWYREPLVWMLILIPASSVIAGIAMIYLAIVTDDGLVVDDYYRQGKEINRILARDQEAADLGLSGELLYRRDTGTITLSLHSKSRAPLSAQIKIRFSHATRKGFDQAVVLQKTAHDNYHGLIKTLPAGRWYVQLEAGRWRLLGKLRIPGESRVRFQPRPNISTP